MKRRRTFVRAAATSLVLVSATVARAQDIGTVKGRVTGPTGEPLAGATVSVTGTQRGSVARSDGWYQFTVPAGQYELRARLVGYAVSVESVTVSPGQTTTKNFRATRLTTKLESVAILGTRGEQRTVISAPVPIDVLSAADLRQSGRTETAQMIQAVAPSFNFPRASVADGTDHIRPATLRGLAPDQTLILVNGKRRHTSALVNLNGFVGRGAQAVDLNAIPASMIDRIEILRDGAAAQYGSDAIGGVINIVLKGNAPGSVSFEAGQNVTTYNRDASSQVAFPAQMTEREARDGEVFATGMNYGWSFGERGFLHVGGEVRNRSGTNRSLPDTRQQYFAGDPRNADPAEMHFWQGDSYNRDTQLFLNASHALAKRVELYGFGGYGRRRGASAGMWRRPNDDRTVRAIYPDGFLPFIKSDIDDASGSLGLKGTLGAWRWDLGTTYGRNAFDFTIDNSANVSLGPTSGTSFDAGTLSFSQSTTTLDVQRSIRLPWQRSLNVALGAEYRADRYEIRAGEPDSYRDGGVKVLDANGQPTNRLAPTGSQVFPGFRPSDAGSHDRGNGAAYLDLESEIASRLLVSVAGRFEHYSDFGATTTGKLAGRFNFTDGFALRGAVSTGFRAPSLGQAFFSSTATNFINGVPFDIRTFPVTSAEARLLGARDLEPERSVNLNAGVAMTPARGLAVTADVYRITIDDRVVLSDNFTGAAIQTLFTNAGLNGVSGGRFFSNAIDTRSTGVDVVLSYDATIGSSSVLRLTSGYNHNVVKVTRVDSTPPELRAFQETLFGRVERTRIEHGNPRDNLILSANYAVGALGLTARTQRYGEVRVAGTTPTNATGTLDQTYGAKWVTDLAVSYTLRSRYNLTVGADNVLDVYPDRNLNPGDPATANGGLSNFGIFPYNGISPFGFNGRFVYSKISVGL